MDRSSPLILHVFLFGGGTSVSMAWYTLFALTTVLMLNSAKRSKKAKQLTAQVSSLEAEMKQRQEDASNSNKEARALLLPKVHFSSFVVLGSFPPYLLFASH